MVTGTEDIDIEHHNALKTDPESFLFECLSVEDVDKLLNESIECLCNMINCAPSLAKTLLLEHRWSVNEIVKRYRENATELLVSGISNVMCQYFFTFFFNFFFHLTIDIGSNKAGSKS